MTWLELLVGFELDGEVYLPRCTGFAAPGVNALSAGNTVGQLVTLFRQQVLQLVGEHCTRDAKRLFHRAQQNCQRGQARLHKLGITGAWGRAYTCPQWSSELAGSVQQALLRQVGHPVEREGPLAVGPLHVRPKPINKSSQPRWRNHWERLSKPGLDSETRHKVVTQQLCQVKAQDSTKTAQCYQVACQSCTATIVLPEKPVKLMGEWPRLKCQSCKSQVRAGAATCLLCSCRVSKCSCGVTAKVQTTLVFWELLLPGKRATRCTHCPA